jgi:hypothetical protein
MSRMRSIRTLALCIAVAAAALLAVHPILAGTPFRYEAAVCAGTGPRVSLTAAIAGSAATGTATIANDGSSRGSFSLTSRVRGDRALGRDLRLTASSGGRVRYSGSLAGFRSLALGELAPGESRVVRLRVTLPSGSGAPQGRRVVATFGCDAA